MVRLLRAIIVRFLPLLFGMLVCSQAFAQEVLTEDPTLWEVLKSSVLPPMIAALGTLLPVLIVFLKSKLCASIRQHVDNKAAQSAALWAADMAFELVNAANQTSVQKLKGMLKDGRLSAEEYKSLLMGVKKEVWELLKDRTVGKLVDSGVVTSEQHAGVFAGALVESAVRKAKILGGAPPQDPSRE